MSGELSERIRQAIKEDIDHIFTPPTYVSKAHRIAKERGTKMYDDDGNSYTLTPEFIDLINQCRKEEGF